MAQKKTLKHEGCDNINEPRPIGEILHDNLENGNDSLYVAYRKYKKDAENGILFKDFYPNTELGMDIKLLTRKPGRLPIGEAHHGFITRDGETHMTFTEGDAAAAKVRQKRNPKPFEGQLITFTQREDDTYRLNFKDFVIESSLTMKELRKLANNIKNEIINGYPGLIVKNSK